MALTFKFFIFLFLAHFSCSSPTVEKIKLDCFRAKITNHAIRVFLDNPKCNSVEDEEKARPIIELGHHLSKHGLDLTKAEHIGTNKLKFGNDVTLELKNTEQDRCMEVGWQSTENRTFQDCFDLSPYNWYGGPEQNNQYWPIETATFADYSYVTKEQDGMAIAEPYWFNSDGMLIYVKPSVPLFIDQNNVKNGSLCLVAKHAAPYMRSGGPHLNYTVCKFENPREAHEYAIKTFLGKPTGIPDARMVKEPIWSTWVRYKTEINESIILDFAKQIKDHGFLNNSQLEIDDLWETCYGSLTINKTRFPDMKGLVKKLKEMDFRTTIWVHPFINFDCPTHQEAESKGYLVKNTEGNLTTTWWNGKGSYIDFTKKEAADWYETRLWNLLNDTHIDSLKFDAGESSWPPQVPVLQGPEVKQPEIITDKYVNLVAKFGPMVEARSGYNTQHLPIFIRMIDRNSDYGVENAGMTTVITTTFQMTLNGYPFVLPDMVGGNAYNGDKVTKEMFVRWLQVNTFLPAIQFSIPPWDYGAETVELTKKCLALHTQYGDKIVALMGETVKTGKPINTPIWWVDPTNKDAHPINDEYMLGDDILVAPVVEEGATSRDIYLPKGQWRDEVKSDKPVITGPTWLRNYPAPLDTLPYFTLVSSNSTGKY